MPPFPSLSTDTLPRTEAEVAVAAAAIGLTVPDACLPGVLANLALLASHAERLLADDTSPCD